MLSNRPWSALRLNGEHDRTGSFHWFRCHCDIIIVSLSAKWRSSSFKHNRRKRRLQAILRTASPSYSFFLMVPQLPAIDLNVRTITKKTFHSANHQFDLDRHHLFWSDYIFVVLARTVVRAGTCNACYTVHTNWNLWSPHPNKVWKHPHHIHRL